MAKGNTTTQVNQSNLPDYAQPYFTDLLDRTGVASNMTYTPYGGQRLAGTTADTQAGWDVTRNIAGQGIPNMGAATAATGQAMGATAGVTGGMTPYQFSDPGMWNASTAGQYMSPYTQNVLDVQKNRAQLDFDRAQQGRDAQAVQSGAFGNDRRGVVDALAQEGLTRNMQEIDAFGMDRAYESGAAKFQADRAAGMNVEQAQAGQNLAAGHAQLQGLGLIGQQAGQLANFGNMSRNAGIQGSQMLQNIGQQQQAQTQAGMDIAYDDFLRQLNYPQSQLQFYNSMLRGVPIAPSTTSTTYTQGNPAQNALGMGLSAIGMYQGLSA